MSFAVLPSLRASLKPRVAVPDTPRSFMFIEKARRDRLDVLELPQNSFELRRVKSLTVWATAPLLIRIKATY